MTDSDELLWPAVPWPLLTPTISVKASIDNLEVERRNTKTDIDSGHLINTLLIKVTMYKAAKRIMVASKFLNDDGEEDKVFNNKWASSGGMDAKELNRLKQCCPSEPK